MAKMLNPTLKTKFPVLGEMLEQLGTEKGHKLIDEVTDLLFTSTRESLKKYVPAFLYPLIASVLEDVDARLDAAIFEAIAEANAEPAPPHDLAG